MFSLDLVLFVMVCVIKLEWGRGFSLFFVYLFILGFEELEVRVFFLEIERVFLFFLGWIRDSVFV